MSGWFRRRTRHEMPELNTSSLPDLIFTVLFFFMLVTHMRDVELKVRYEVPQGKELQKLTHKSAVTYIYIGKLSRKGSPENIDRYFIQLNEQLASIEEIKAYLERERAKMNDEDRSRMVVSIKADKQVPMGIIADVKKELQSAFALKINYSAVETN